MSRGWFLVEVIVFIGGLYVGKSMAPDDARQEFFEIAAQVLPVLILVLAIEQRAFLARRFVHVEGARGTEFLYWAAVLYRLAVFFLLFIAEVSALDVVAIRDDDAPHAAWGIYGAITASFALIALGAFRIGLDDSPKQRGKRAAASRSVGAVAASAWDARPPDPPA